MSDPLFGVNWSLEKGSSIFSTSLSPDTETRLYEEIGGGYKLTVSGSHRGKQYSWGYTAKYDGKDHPVHGRADADAIEAYRVNDRITVGFFKKGGVYCGPYSRSISQDGRTLTVQTVGRQDDGTVFFDVKVYKRP